MYSLRTDGCLRGRQGPRLELSCSDLISCVLDLHLTSRSDEHVDCDTRDVIWRGTRLNHTTWFSERYQELVYWREQGRVHYLQMVVDNLGKLWINLNSCGFLGPSFRPFWAVPFGLFQSPFVATEKTCDITVRCPSAIKLAVYLKDPSGNTKIASYQWSKQLKQLLFSVNIKLRGRYSNVSVSKYSLSSWFGRVQMRDIWFRCDYRNIQYFWQLHVISMHQARHNVRFLPSNQPLQPLQGLCRVKENGGQTKVQARECVQVIGNYELYFGLRFWNVLSFRSDSHSQELLIILLHVIVQINRWNVNNFNIWIVHIANPAHLAVL